MNSQALSPAPDNIREVIENSGVSIADWARENQFSASLVYQVLKGKRRCIRGESHRIAVALGLKQGEALNAHSLSERLKALAARQR